MPYIDMNADLGESFGPYKLGDDDTMLSIVSSANVACGFHAGDPEVMYKTFSIAKARGVAAGAHPGFHDREYFGRRSLPHTVTEIERLVAYQIGAACSVAALAGHKITYVKAHGALGNLAAADESVSRAVARATKAVDRELISLSIATTWSERGARSEGLEVVAEIFADRAYQPNGDLVPRSKPGAVLHNAEDICRRVVAMLAEQAIIAVDGTMTPTNIDSICVHGDTPGAAAIAKQLKDALILNHYEIAAFAPIKK